MRSHPAGRGAVAAIAALSVGLAGCARSAATTVPRRLDGEIVNGPAVAPRSYERFLEGELALARGDLRAARQAFEGASPELDPVVLGRLAEVVAKLGDTAEAERLLAEGERRFPRSEALWLARGRIAEAGGASDDALRAYRRAAELAPSSPEGVLPRAAILERLSRREEALDLLAQYVAREPERSPAAWHRYIVLLVATGGSAVSIEQAAESLHELAPQHDDDLRALAERTVASNRPEAALHLLRPLPRTASDVRTFLLALAAVEGSEAALALLDRTPDRLVGDSLGRGQLLLELGRPAMAAALAEAIAEARAEPAAFLLLGRAERSRGQTAAALAALRRVPVGSRDYVPAQIETARALADSGQAARARRILLDLEPTYGEAWPEIAATLENITAADAAAGREAPRRQ